MLEIDSETALKLRPFAKPYRRDGEILARRVKDKEWKDKGWQTEQGWEIKHAGATWRLDDPRFESAYHDSNLTSQTGLKVVREAGWTTALPLTEAFRLRDSDVPPEGGIVYELDGTWRVCQPRELATMTPIDVPAVPHVFVSYAHDDPSNGLLFLSLLTVDKMLRLNHQGLSSWVDTKQAGKGSFPTEIADKIATASSFLVVVSDEWVKKLDGWARRFEYPFILLREEYEQAPVAVVSVGCDVESIRKNHRNLTAVFGPSSKANNICDRTIFPIDGPIDDQADVIFAQLNAQITSFKPPAESDKLAILESARRVTVAPVGHLRLDAPPKLRTAPYGADPSVVLQSNKGVSSAAAYAQSAGPSRAFASDDGRLLAFSTAGTLSCIGVVDVEAAAGLPRSSRGVDVVWRSDADAATDPVLAVNRLVRVLAVACRSGVFLVDSAGAVTGRFPLADSKDAALIRSSLVTVDDKGALHAMDLLPGISTGLLEAVGLLEQVGDGDWQAVDAAIERAADGSSERVVIAALRGAPVVDELVIVSYGLSGTSTVIRHGRLDRPADSVAIGRGLDHLDRVLVLSAAEGARQINESEIPEWSRSVRDGLSR